MYGSQQQKQLPSVLSICASAAAKQPEKNVFPCLRRMPIFGHWFATEVWDIFSRDHSLDSDLKLQLDDQSYELSRSKLDSCAEEFCTTVLHCSESVGVSFLKKTNEVSFSALATAIFGDLFVGCTVKSYGQLVIAIRGDDNRKFDTPDHVLAKIQDHLPAVCILVGDSKCKSLDEGRNQVFIYMRSLQSQNLCLGMVITFQQVLLQLFIPFDGKFSVIDICSANCNSINEVKNFFLALYVAVRRLSHPIPAPAHAITLKCCSQPILCPNEDEFHKFLRRAPTSATNSMVIHCLKENVVKKFYDQKYNFIPRHEVIHLIPGAEFLNPPRSKYQVLQYPYLKGSNKLENADQLVAAIKALDCFHAIDFVHGDIREINMIVCEDKVFFIDVDLAKKEGEDYPSVYNHADIVERHKNAIANGEMKKIHDRYALYQIISKANLLIPCLEDLLDITKSLQSIATSVSKAKELGE